MFYSTVYVLFVTSKERVNILSNTDSTNYLHIAGQSASNAADYINATMMAVSGWTHTNTHTCTYANTHMHTALCSVELL